jgi:hypothetical protein
MKTARRQELRTNEFAQQLEDAVLFMRKHGGLVIGVAAVVLVVTIGGWLYWSGRKADLNAAWAELYSPQALANVSPADQTAYYRRLADRKLDPLLTAMSLIRIGEISLSIATDPDLSEQERADWGRKAEAAYREALDRFGHLKAPASLARIALGVLAENRGDFAEARRLYQQLVDDPKYAGLPVSDQARFRLTHLDGWTAAIEFPPPLPPPEPVTLDDAAMQPTDLTPPAMPEHDEQHDHDDHTGHNHEP